MVDIKEELLKIFEGKKVTFSDPMLGPIITYNGKRYEATTFAVKFLIHAALRIEGAIKVRYFDIIENNEIRVYLSQFYIGEKFKIATEEDISKLTLEQKQYIIETAHQGINPDTFEVVLVSNGVGYPVALK